MNPVNLDAAFEHILQPWTPRIAGALNGQEIKLVRLQGEFVWHHHDQADELFLVLEGAFRMQFRDREVTVRSGEFIIVPRGVEHRPVADTPCRVLLLEPAGTLNTGNVRDAHTVDHPEHL